MKKSKRITLTIFALIGLALSIELCFVYYNANFAVNAKPSICAISESMDCDGVAKTAFSQVFGIPLSLWGVLLYLMFLFLTYVDKLQNLPCVGILKVFKNPSRYIFTIGIFSFICSMILGCISVFKIGSVCIFCFMTYIVNLIIGLTAKTSSGAEISEKITAFDEIKTTVVDFIDAVKKYFILFVVVVICFIAVLVYTSTTNILAPQMKIKKELQSYYGSFKNLANGNRIGPADADLVVHEYMDFNCGGCYFAHLYIHRILKEFDNVAFVQHNLPLDKKCNHNMQHDGHPNSCLKSYYALAAAKQNKYWMMADILFRENVKTEADIISEARLIDLDVKKLKADAHSDEIKNEVIESISEADSKNIQSTPTMYIGMKRVTGVGSYPDFKQTISEQGGKEKK